MRSPSRVLPVKKPKYKFNQLISEMYNKLGEKRTTSREQTVSEVETQMIDDRYGDCLSKTLRSKAAAFKE